MTEWKKYQRKGLSEMMPYREGLDMAGVSIADVDIDNGSPRPGDMIARNPKNHNDKWLVAEKYFLENLEPEACEAGASDAEIFVNHIKKHMEEMGPDHVGLPRPVMCKICHLTIDEVVEEETGKV